MGTQYANQMEESKPDFNRRLLCIEYPGRVENVNNMLDTLGGIKSISTAYGEVNRRVELRFRPNDIFCKPVCGNRYSTVGLLVKVKVKKKLRDPNQPCSSKDSDKLQSVTFTTSLVGVVDTIYKFENLCEFQYLPMDRININNENPDGRLIDIHDRIFPPNLPNLDWLNTNEVPYFFTPAVFSRFDTIHFYSGNKDITALGKPNRQVQKRREVPSIQTIGRTRKRRQNYGRFVKFIDAEVPMEPNPEAIRLLTVKFVTEEQRNLVEKLFEERPIWSKNSLHYRTNFSRDQLKFILPTLAYYYTTGPWRVMWCKYGYDPRKNSKNVIYQTFDFRIKHQQGFNVKSKRGANVLLPYKSTPSSRPKIVIMNRHSISRAVHKAKSENKSKPVNEEICTFRPGFVPTCRQIFYQYCDLLVPEIQKMLEELLPKLSETAHCDFQMGFLPPGFDNKCREIINSLIQDELLKNKNKPSTSLNDPINDEEEESMDEDEANDEDDEEEDIEIIESDLEEMIVD